MLRIHDLVCHLVMPIYVTIDEFSCSQSLILYQYGQSCSRNADFMQHVDKFYNYAHNKYEATKVPTNIVVATKNAKHNP